MYGYITQVDFTSFFLETGKIKNLWTAMEIPIKYEDWILLNKTNIESGLSISCIMTNVMIIQHTLAVWVINLDKIEEKSLY